MANDHTAAILRKPNGVDGLFGTQGSVLHLLSGSNVPLPERKEDGVGDKRRIVLIRHGATRLNNKDVSVDRVRGWKDIPLSPEGKQEAQRVGQKIKNSMKPDVLVPSDLHRAQETARIISKVTGVPLSEPTEGFRPWNVGQLAGQLTKKAIPILSAYACDKPEKPVPGGESFNDFKSRFLTALRDALDKHEGTVGVVTHHRGERLLKAWGKEGFHKEGNINLAEFNKKGEHTGSAEEMEIPVRHLAAAVDHLGTEGRRFDETMSNGSSRAKEINDLPDRTK